MTGTIMTFDIATTSGVISMEDERLIRFDSRAVLAYDVRDLAVGRSVSFELLLGTNPKAFNVCVEPLYFRRAGMPNRENALPRYIGFQQSGNMRLYHFERMLAGEGKKEFTVNIDMALFMKHHVAIQEGPVLCLGRLVAALDATGFAVAPSPEYVLTDRELVAYLTDRPLPGKRPPFRRQAHSHADASSKRAI